MKQSLKNEFSTGITSRIRQAESRAAGFSANAASGLALVALASLLGADNAAGVGNCEPPIRWRPSIRPSTPKAKRVIYLFMGGAPSQLDLFDYKPALAQIQRQTCATRKL